MRTVYMDGEPVHHLSCVLCLGTFDGVHRGHQAIIDHAKYLASERGVPVALLTFEPHPRSVLSTNTAYRHVLTPLPTKISLLESAGVDIVYVKKFERAFASLSCEQFVDGVLRQLEPVEIVVGYNYSFGAGGIGTAQTLHDLCARHQINVSILDPFVHEGRQVSSSAIRDCLARGDVSDAQALLGRPFTLEGIVEHGDGRGRTIGFPTANLSVEQPFVIPRYGVYLVRASVGEHVGYAISNIGVRPTFTNEDPPLRVETHLFQFSRDIYGEPLRIELLAFIRDERKFASIEALIDQIRTDVHTAEAIAATR